MDTERIAGRYSVVADRFPLWVVGREGRHLHAQMRSIHGRDMPRCPMPNTWRTMQPSRRNIRPISVHLEGRRILGDIPGAGRC